MNLEAWIAIGSVVFTSVAVPSLIWIGRLGGRVQTLEARVESLESNETESQASLKRLEAGMTDLKETLHEAVSGVRHSLDLIAIKIGIEAVEDQFRKHREGGK